MKEEEKTHVLPCGNKRAQLVGKHWQPQFRLKLFWFIPTGWDFYGYDYGDDVLLGLGLTPYHFITKEKCIDFLNNET